jgi:hypothetical protein
MKYEVEGFKNEAVIDQPIDFSKDLFTMQYPHFIPRTLTFQSGLHVTG